MTASRLLALTVMAALAGAQTAQAASTGLCDFVAKVAKAEPNHFMVYKGEEDTTLGHDHTVFDGTLTPEGATGCKLYLREGDHGYSCNYNLTATPDQAAAIYKEKADVLRSCPAGAAVSEKTLDDKESGMAGTSLKLISKTWHATLDESNSIDLLARAFGAAETGPVTFAVTLDFEDDVKVPGAKKK